MTRKFEKNETDQKNHTHNLTKNVLFGDCTAAEACGSGAAVVATAGCAVDDFRGTRESKLMMKHSSVSKQGHIQSDCLRVNCFSTEVIALFGFSP